MTVEVRKDRSPSRRCRKIQPRPIRACACASAGWWRMTVCPAGAGRRCVVQPARHRAAGGVLPERARQPALRRVAFGQSDNRYNWVDLSTPGRWWATRRRIGLRIGWHSSDKINGHRRQPCRRAPIFVAGWLVACLGATVAAQAKQGQVIGQDDKLMLALQPVEEWLDVLMRQGSSMAPQFDTDQVVMGVVAGQLVRPCGRRSRRNRSGAAVPRIRVCGRAWRGSWPASGPGTRAKISSKSVWPWPWPIASRIISRCGVMRKPRRRSRLA